MRFYELKNVPSFLEKMLTTFLRYRALIQLVSILFLTEEFPAALG